MIKKIAFLGLGVMGYPMAGHLKKSGFDVEVYNRTKSKSEKWVREFGGNFVNSPAEAAKNSQLIFSCVGNDNDLREITIGNEGAFNTMSEQSIFIDHTTASAIISKELAKLANSKNFGFLDAPISGGQSGAENGVLTIMVGGEKDYFEKAKPIMKSYAKMIKLLGPSGYGQLTKMVNQICIAGLLEGLAEGIHFAKKVGLDVEEVIETISKGAAQSWQMENRHKTMNNDEYDHGFAVDWMRKDLGIALEEGRSRGINLPITALVDQLYSEVQSIGGSRWDTSSLLKRLEFFSKK